MHFILIAFTGIDNRPHSVRFSLDEVQVRYIADGLAVYLRDEDREIWPDAEVILTVPYERLLRIQTILT